MINPMELTGKKILVVGATSETGKVIVNQLSLLGAELVLIDKSEDELLEIQQKTSLGDIKYYAFDLYDNSEIEPHFKRMTYDCGAFDGFVYCAGIGGVRPLSLTKYMFIHEMMNANLYTFIEMVRCITKRGSFITGGSIVAISSVSSVKGLKSKTAYCASKAAIDASVRSMAAELSEKKIRVNSILKGWVESDMKMDFIKSNMELSENDDFKKQLLGAIEPIEVANTVAFLLSDCTKTITGTSLLLDGGYTL
ncbi:MAG: SDR family oxidoreductase [Paludibacter sp.]|nr:SDR family oxidoreductase [Paludibacter sp.]